MQAGRMEYDTFNWADIESVARNPGMRRFHGGKILVLPYSQRERLRQTFESYWVGRDWKTGGVTWAFAALPWQEAKGAYAAEDWRNWRWCPPRLVDTCTLASEFARYAQRQGFLRALKRTCGAHVRTCPHSCEYANNAKRKGLKVVPGTLLLDDDYRRSPRIVVFDGSLRVSAPDRVVPIQALRAVSEHPDNLYDGVRDYLRSLLHLASELGPSDRWDIESATEEVLRGSAVRPDVPRTWHEPIPTQVAQTVNGSASDVPLVTWVFLEPVLAHLDFISPQFRSHYDRILLSREGLIFERKTEVLGYPEFKSKTVIGLEPAPDMGLGVELMALADEYDWEMLVFGEQAPTTATQPPSAQEDVLREMQRSEEWLSTKEISNRLRSHGKAWSSSSVQKACNGLASTGMLQSRRRPRPMGGTERIYARF